MYQLPISCTLLVLLASAARAAEPVRVSVVAILVHDRDDKVDPRLKCIAEEVRKAVPQLKDKGFKMGRMTCESVTVGKPTAFDLVDGQKATVEVVRAGDKNDLIQVKLVPPMMGEIAYETTCGQFLPVITR